MTRLLAATATLLVAATAADAQNNCAQREVVIERLAERYGESRQSIGLGTENRVVETFASLEAGTWTITVTLPSGVTCLVASGTGFERLDEAPAPAGEAS